MFGKLFGKKMSDAEREAAEAAFADAKQAALERVLGPMDDTVLHALIPFALGGGLDLYTFSSAGPGVVFVTQELISREPGDRPKKSRVGWCELVACLPPGTPRDDEAGVELINSVLNPVAQFVFHARVSPGETAEIPTDEEGKTQGVVFWEYEGKAPFELTVDGKTERFGLMLVVPVLPIELGFARREGVPKLVEKMKSKGAWPWANLKRGAAV